MKKNYTNNKAEDILTDDQLVTKITGKTQTPDIHQFDNEFVLATDIYNEISSQKQKLNSSQKDQLGHEIVRSIRVHKRKKLILSISSAAVLLLLVTISVLITVHRDSYLRSYAANNNLLPTSGNTLLVLSGEEEIQIYSQESRIEYTGNGQIININTTEKISQDVEKNKVVLNTVVVPYGKQTQITLSDSSTIWLNSGSKLIYPARFTKEKREVYLEGEAIFKVSHDKAHPFHVVTRDLEVKVLGTVFNVSAYNDDVTTNTTLVSGSVELIYNGNSLFGKSSELMIPNMLAVYDPEKGTINQSKVNTEQYTSWREGYFTFKQQSLGEIIKKLSRYYNVPIKLSDQKLENETFTGYLDLKKNATQVMEIIAEIIDVSVKITDNQILITKS